MDKVKGGEEKVEMQMSLKRRLDVVDKFRIFWRELDAIEQEDLWHVLTSLRGCDISQSYSNLKEYTTSRIRYGLLDKSEDYGHIGCIVTAYPLDKTSIKARDKMLETGHWKSDSEKDKVVSTDHFGIHAKSAINVLVELKKLPKEEICHIQINAPDVLVEPKKKDRIIGTR